MGCADAVGDFLLEHAHTFRHPITPVEHFEEDLAADVVGEVAGHGKGSRHAERFRSAAEQIGRVNVLRVHPFGVTQVGHGLGIDFHHVYGFPEPFQERTGQCARARAHFEDLRRVVLRQEGSDADGDSRVLEEVLSEVLLGCNPVVSVMAAAAHWSRRAPWAKTRMVLRKARAFVPNFSSPFCRMAGAWSDS